MNENEKGSRWGDCIFMSIVGIALIVGCAIWFIDSIRQPNFSTYVAVPFALLGFVAGIYGLRTSFRIYRRIK